MTSQYKICNNCGEKVDVEYNFCPNCKSQSFRQSAVEVKAESRQLGIVYNLMYWNYDGKHVMSKSKVGGICVFLMFFVCALAIPPFYGGLIVAVFFSLFTFLSGCLIHYVSLKPGDAVISNNDYGVLKDLKHLFLYWQNQKTGEFVLSKTKIASIAIFVVFFFVGASMPNSNLFTMIMMGLLFEIPAFVIGFLVHRFTNPDPTNKKPKVVSAKPKKIPEVKKVEHENEAPETEKASVPEFEKYRREITALQSEFDAKEETARELIEKRFHPPQMTYTKFISLVDKANSLFDRETDAAFTILNLATEDSPRIDGEIKSKIEVLNAIIDKTDDLIDELVLTMDSSSEGDVDSLIDDMDDLIGTLKDYK